METLISVITSVELGLILFLIGSVRFVMKRLSGFKGLTIPTIFAVYGLYICTPDYVGVEKIQVMLFILSIVVLFRALLNKAIQEDMSTVSKG